VCVLTASAHPVLFVLVRPIGSPSGSETVDVFVAQRCGYCCLSLAESRDLFVVF